jgi:VCBS repeat-containing protein
MKSLLSLASLLLLSFSSWAQATIPYSESFETDGAGSRYSVFFSPLPTALTNLQYFTRATNTVAGFNSVQIGNSGTGLPNGSFFWACEGVQGPTTVVLRPPGTVTLQGITIGSNTNLAVTLAMADARYSTTARSTAARTDSVKVQYSYNNVNFRTIGYFSGFDPLNNNNWRMGGASNSNSADDLTTSLRDFTFSIGTPPTGATTLYVRVEAKYLGGSKEIAFDNIRVSGTVQTVAPPVLTGIGSTTLNYAEGGSPIQVASGLTVTNPSNTTLSGATVQLQASAGVLSTDDVLGFTPVSGITGNYNSTTRTLSFTGTSSIANYQTVLRSVTYVNSDIYNATPGTRRADFTVVDGSRTSAPASQSINVTASLDAPAPLPYTESFETVANAEGTLYSSNTFNQNSQAFTRTSQNPIPGISSTTFSNIEQTGYWYAEGTKATINTTIGKGVLQLRPVNATGFRNLQFTWRLGRGGNNYQTSDFVRLYYDRNDGAGPQLFGAFYGTGTDLRRDADLDGTADASGTQITATLQDITFTLPTSLDNRSDIDFSIEVANDGGKELAFDHIRITGVSNQPPVINAQTFSVAENSANNATVGTVAASDPDAGQTLTYAITAGNTNGAFSINSSTGQLRVANSAALNFETTPAFALTVQVTDNAPSPMSASNTITINLTNVNEAPVIAPQTFSLAENSANGTVVGTVVASDPDAGTTLTYSLTAGNTGGAFAINAATGQLTVANTAALDFETTPTFALTVSVSDGGLATTATITVNLTDVPNAAYVSSTAEQITRGVVAGATNEAILRIPVVLNANADQPLSATSFTFTTAGTTVPANVTAARIYYTGTSGSFATTTLFGSSTAPGTGPIVINGSQVLQPNTNYFWLAYDVAPTAAVGNLLDATLPALTVGGTPRTPTVTAPAGARTVVDPSDVAGTALSFNGTAAGYVDLGTGNPNLVLGQQYTMELWVKPTAASGNTLNGVLGYDPGTPGQRSPYISISENNRVEAGYGNGSSTITAGTANNVITTGQWNQIVATFSGNTLSVYVNGILYSQTIGGGSPVNTAVRYVGTLNPSATTFFKGDVDEVAMWTRALTQSEIRLRRHLLLSGGETSLTSYLQFNEASGNVQDFISGASGPLTGTGVSRVTSTAPVGTGISNLQSVSGSGSVTFTGTGVTIAFTGSGTYSTTVARLNGRPQGTQPSGLVKYYNQAYWIINKYDGGTFSNAAVTYSLNPTATAISTADAASPATTLRLLKRASNSDGAFDAPIAASAASRTPSTVTFNVTSFSQTVVGTLGTSPLPVELVRFTAERQGDTALLDWSTASEKNSDYFAVESSLDGRTFQELSRVEGHGTTARAQAYRFVDAKLTRYGAKEVYYRLRQVDHDGTTAYSPVRTLALPAITGPAQLLAYPNPAHDKVLVLLTSAMPAAQLTLYDAAGRLVRSQSVEADGALTTLPISGLPAGVYVLRYGALSQRLNVE